MNKYKRHVILHSEIYVYITNINNLLGFDKQLLMSLTQYDMIHNTHITDSYG